MLILGSAHDRLLGGGNASVPFVSGPSVTEKNGKSAGTKSGIATSGAGENETSLHSCPTKIPTEKRLDKKNRPLEVGFF